MAAAAIPASHLHTSVSLTVHTAARWCIAALGPHLPVVAIVHTHTQPFNDLLSGTTRVSQYQKNLHPLRPTRKKKDLHRQQGPLRRSSSPLRCFESALSQRVLLNPIKPAYNQSRPGGRLKLTASAFNRLWTSMPAVLPTATQNSNSLHPLSTSYVTARHLLGSMVQGKITEADAPTICLDTTTSGLLVHF